MNKCETKVKVVCGWREHRIWSSGAHLFLVTPAVAKRRAGAQGPARPISAHLDELQGVSECWCADAIKEGRERHPRKCIGRVWGAGCQFAIGDCVAELGWRECSADRR